MGAGKDRLFYGWLFYASTKLMVLTHIVPYVTDAGISAGEAAAVLSLTGGAGGAGNVSMGFIADRIGRKVTAVTCALLMAGAMLWLVGAPQLWMFYLFAPVYGFAYGGVTSSLSALISDAFGLSHLGAIAGLLEVGGGLGAAIGPFLGGLIFDITGSYYLAFSGGAIAIALMAPLVFLIRRESALVGESG